MGITISNATARDNVFRILSIGSFALRGVWVLFPSVVVLCCIVDPWVRCVWGFAVGLG